MHTIIVGPANEEARPYHDPMPAILGPEEFDVWLDPNAARGDLSALLKP